MILPILLTCIAIDGDTLRCGGERIRLLGIDAPEMPGHCRRGRVCAPGDPWASKANLSALVNGADLRAEPVTRDRYRRTVAVVWAGDVNLSCAQLAAGQATYIARWDNGGRVARVCGKGRDGMTIRVPKVCKIVPGGFPDSRFIAHCQQCDVGIALSDCPQTVEAETRRYRCPSCRDLLVIVRRPNSDGLPVPESGYNLGGWVLGNLVDVILQTDGQPVLIPARINADIAEQIVKKRRGIDSP